MPIGCAHRVESDFACCRPLVKRWDEHHKRLAMNLLRGSTSCPTNLCPARWLLQAGLARSQREEAQDVSSKSGRAENLDLNRDRVVEGYRASLALQGDRQRGARYFATNCLNCHAVQGLGPTVGPDITSVASRSKPELLVDVLDPSRRVAPNFVAYTAVTAEGVATAGIIAAETEHSVTLLQEQNKEFTFRLSELVDLRPSSKSIMPDGFESKLDVQAIADLLAFLNAPQRDMIESLSSEKR